MGQFFDALPDHLIQWIKQQKMFWVASAPLTLDGHVNLSPKGFEGTFHIVNSHQVWYEDMCGSGIETISHLKENKRITVLFHAFEGPPRIVRLFGRGTVYEFGTPEYEKLLPVEVRQPGSRAVIMIDIFKVGSSCGFAIPFYTYRAPRMLLHRMNAKQEVIDIRAEDTCAGALEPARGGMKEYWQKENVRSLDGLPGLTVAYDSTTTFKQSGPYPKDDVRIANTTESLFDTRSVLGFLFGILVSVAFVQLRTYIVPFLMNVNKV